MVAAVLNLAVELLEQQRFIVPSEKFMLLRVVSLALCLLFSLSFAYKLATILASRLLQLHIFTLSYL